MIPSSIPYPVFLNPYGNHYTCLSFKTVFASFKFVLICYKKSINLLQMFDRTSIESIIFYKGKNRISFDCSKVYIILINFEEIMRENV